MEIAATTLPRVSLFIEASRAYGRGLLLGIVKYVRANRPWSIDYQECRLGELTPQWLKKRPADGIIARVTDRRLAQALKRAGRPVVDVFGQVEAPGLPSVCPDQEGVAAMAAEHLLQLGFKQFGYCGFAAARYSQARQAGFCRLIAAAGRQCHVYQAPAAARARRTAGPEAFSWEQHGHSDDASLVAWLEQLPRPAAIMTCNCIRGQQVLTACRRLGLMVPEEIAVIGVDDDEIVCELCDPPLSSVILGAETAGYEAAALLDRLMRGQSQPERPLLIAPVGVTARRSTDVVAFDDLRVAKALRFIRARACDDIGIADIMKESHLSRSGLHRRFAAAMGRSPKAEILRVRVERAKNLLVETDLALAEVALRCGFSSAEHFCCLFKAKTGESPGAYRRALRAATGPRRP